jgi:hypothetical protein
VNKNRLQWEGGISGSLLINSAEKITINEPEQLLTLIEFDIESGDTIDFQPGELETLGVAALFMAIRSVLPYERGNVLASAVSIIGGSSRTMIGYCFFPLIQMDYMTLYYFKKGCEKLADYLQPIQTDSQYTLKSAAFDFLRNQISNATGKNVA